MLNTPIFQTDSTTAEMVKYMANCLLATKVIFANEMYDICEKLNINYDEMKEMVVADKRIGKTHLDVTTLRGFGGKCFPKDLLALRSLAKKLGVDTTILDAVWKKNRVIRSGKNLTLSCLPKIPTKNLFKKFFQDFQFCRLTLK